MPMGMPLPLATAAYQVKHLQHIDVLDTGFQFAQIGELRQWGGLDKTKPEVVVAVRNAVVVAVGSPQVPGIVVPGTPAHNATDNAQAMALGINNTQCLCCRQALEKI